MDRLDQVMHGDQLSLLDLIALEDLQQLQDTLADINQVATVVTDPLGNPLTLPSNEITVCGTVQQTDRGASDCAELVTAIQGGVQKRRQPVCQPCQNFGILKAAVPIFIDGHHLANWWISQCCLSLPSEKKMKAYAKRIGVKLDVIMQALDASPKGDRENFDKILEWTDRLAHRIAKLGYQNLLLTRDLSKLKRFQNELGRHETEVDSLVRKRTKELTSVNTRLQLEVLERELVEEQSARKSKLLDAVNGIFKLALSNQREINLPQAFLLAAQEITGSAFGLLVERQKHGWQVAAASQLEKNLPGGQKRGNDLPTGPFDMGGIWQELVEGGDPISIPTIDDPSAWQPFPKGYPQVHSLLAVPLQQSRNTSGFIALANNQDGYAPIDQTDVETLANAFIEVLTRRRLERTQSDTQLRLHLALESANEGLWDYNPQTEKIYYSDHWFTMLGYVADEYPQTLETWRTLTRPDELSILEETLHSLSQGSKEAFGIEIRMLSRSGQWSWVQVRGKCVEWDDNGQATRIVGTLNDISKYKHTEVALQKANDELLRLAALDDLTQIANRRRFDDRLTQEWRRAQRDKQSVAVIICDIDYFKNYNDTYGHLQGDEALYAVAQAINATLKRPMDLVARYGGEEFALVLPATDIVGAKRVANEIKEALAVLGISHKASKVSKHITLSFGVAAIVPLADMEPKVLIEFADRALYRAKEMGRNQIIAAPNEGVEMKEGAVGTGDPESPAPEKEQASAGDDQGPLEKTEDSLEDEKGSPEEVEDSMEDEQDSHEEDPDALDS